MAWEGSTRRETLPDDWRQLRAQRFRMDGHRCVAEDAVTGERCTGPAEECDHIGNRLDHRLHNLQSLCSWHHQQKSSRQGREARDRRLERHAQRFLRTEEHPGLL